MFTLAKTSHPPFHFPPPKRHENGAEIWKYQEGATQRAGLATTGHQLHPTAEKVPAAVGRPNPLLPLPSSGTPWAPLGPRAVDPGAFAQSKEQLMWPQAVPIHLALCTGSFLAGPGFPPCPTTAPPDLLFSQRGPCQQLGRPPCASLCRSRPWPW